MECSVYGGGKKNRTQSMTKFHVFSDKGAQLETQLSLEILER